MSKEVAIRQDEGALAGLGGGSIPLGPASCDISGGLKNCS